MVLQCAEIQGVHVSEIPRELGKAWACLVSSSVVTPARSMSINAPPITLAWVAVGERAFGLVCAERIVALVYWEPANVAEQAGDPAVTEAGFSWVPTDLPWEHVYLFEASAPCEGDWARARELAARAYFEWIEP
jgi:hypothetical protein